MNGFQNSTKKRGSLISFQKLLEQEVEKGGGVKQMEQLWWKKGRKRSAISHLEVVFIITWRSVDYETTPILESRRVDLLRENRISARGGIEPRIESHTATSLWKYNLEVRSDGPNVVVD